jgi:energy-coupling factor transporter ATP-binding protein EcfA2
VNINFIEILDFLGNYSNKDYQKVEKISDANKKKEVENIKNKANSMIQQWKKLYQHFADKGYVYNTKSASQWLNGSNTKVRDYLWVEFKKSNKVDYSSSISIFAELKGNEKYLRIVIEIRGSESDRKLRDKHNRYLDYLDFNDNSIEYFGSEDDYVNYRKLDISEVRSFINKVKNSEATKIQVGKVINYEDIDSKGNDWALEALDKYFKLLEKYYEKCVSDDNENIQNILDNAEVDHLDNNRNLVDITKYITKKGYMYSFKSLSNFYLSLKTKPFVILAGISGTGKSKLVKLFAEAINANYTLIPVKPDWNDSTELLGYKNIKDEFVPGKLLEVIKEAYENKEKPYLVCLDEMNLARVEYYLSEYLSIIESREFNDQEEIVTDNIFPNNYLPEDSQFKGITIPDNLYIIGTVNMDDTTFAFSRKVLDRANTIEFSEVNLESLDFMEENAESINVNNSFLKTNFLNIKDSINTDKPYVEKINKKIVEINNILKPHSKHFGYRVRDEIVFYMLENHLAGLLDEDTAFDYQIMQKILPTIIGSDECIKDILIQLFSYCTDGMELNPEEDYVEEAKKYKDSAKYRLSANKIYMMLRGYSYGYTSFWI